jgi:hypothetical protein
MLQPELGGDYTPVYSDKPFQVLETSFIVCWMNRLEIIGAIKLDMGRGSCMERKSSVQGEAARYRKLHLSSLSVNYLRLTNVYMSIWWAFCFPGFGQWYQGRYIYGLILILWEFFMNLKSNLNLAIFYSMIGRFDAAKASLDPKWFLLYVVMYVFAVWDSYHYDPEINKFTVLANRENQTLTSFDLSPFTMIYVSKRKPWMIASWSLLLPGAGQLVLQRKLLAVFLIFWWMVTCYFSHIPQGVTYSLLGDFRKAASVLNPVWLLFIPSLYMFAVYDSYISTNTLNNYYEEGLAQYLKKHWGSAGYRIPYPRGGG